MFGRLNKSVFRKINVFYLVTQKLDSKIKLPNIPSIIQTFVGSKVC